MQACASGHQPVQDTFRQGLVVIVDRHTVVLEKALPALLEAVADLGQGQRGHNLPHLQAFAAQDAQGHRRQIDHTGQGLQRQIVVQLGTQVGKHFILWFDHRSLHGERDFSHGYNRSRPSPRRLSSSQPCLTSPVPQSANHKGYSSLGKDRSKSELRQKGRDSSHLNLVSPNQKDQPLSLSLP